MKQLRGLLNSWETLLVVLLLLVKPLGAYIAAVYDGRSQWVG